MSERDDELDGQDDDWLDEDDDAPVRPRRSGKPSGKARKAAGGGAAREADPEAADAADPDDGELEAYPQRSRRGPSGSGTQRRSVADDDLDDDWDEEDDWDRSGPGGQRRDLTYVIGIVAVVIIVVLVVLLVNKDDDKGSNDNAATTTTPGQTTPGGTEAQDKGGFCGNLPPQLGGQGKVARTGPDGVYLWSDFFGLHIRGKGSGVQTVKITATAEIKVKDAPDPKNEKEKELYTEDYAAWRDAASKGGKTAVDGNVLTITLPASTTPLGPNLDIPCEVTDMTIEVQDANGGDVAADQIHLGDTGQAVGNPFEVKREPGK